MVYSYLGILLYFKLKSLHQKSIILSSRGLHDLSMMWQTHFIIILIFNILTLPYQPLETKINHASFRVWKTKVKAEDPHTCSVTVSRPAGLWPWMEAELGTRPVPGGGRGLLDAGPSLCAAHIWHGGKSLLSLPGQGGGWLQLFGFTGCFLITWRTVCVESYFCQKSAGKVVPFFCKAPHYFPATAPYLCWSSQHKHGFGVFLPLGA